MACALTQGFTISCRDGIGGLLSAYIIEFANVTAMTEASGNISALTKATGKRFWKYELEQNTSMFDQKIVGSRENGTVYYEHEFTLVINNNSAALRNEILLLAKNRCLIVVTDRNGNSWLLGKTNGMVCNAGNSGSGTQAGDRNGTTLTFSSQEPELAPTVASGVVSALETAG